MPMSSTPTVRLEPSASRTDPGRDIAVLPPTDARTTAEVLKELRRAFPDMPLAERVAALARGAHIPR